MPVYQTAVFIGRFQPFHRGHLFVFHEALKHAEQLIVLVGSSGGARTLRNPFYFAERQAMITAALPADMAARIIIKPLQDFTYNDAAWVQSVTQLVNECINNKDSGSNQSVALVGHDKDETTFYLKLFPDWAYIEVGNLQGIHSTALRQAYFSAGQPGQFNSDIILPSTVSWLRQFATQPGYSALVEEYRAVKKFTSLWQNTPYPVIFTTVDALVRWRDEILLIQRKHYPGKNLWALPGGFLHAEETLLDSCLRELDEETHLAVDKACLVDRLVSHRVFDSPKRSARGRVISACYYFDLSVLSDKPLVSADDDAQAAAWTAIAQLDRAQFFEDHFFIIQTLLRES